MKLLNIPRYRQTYEYDCGSTSIQMVLAYYGVDVRKEKIMKIACTDKTGTNPKNMIRTLKKFKLVTEAKEMSLDDVKKFVDKKTPVILLIQAWSRKKNPNWKKLWTSGHYVIAIGYDKNRIYFADPASIHITSLKNQEFIERWHDIDIYGKKFINFGIAVNGKKPAPVNKIIKMD